MKQYAGYPAVRSGRALPHSAATILGFAGVAAAIFVLDSDAGHAGSRTQAVLSFFYPLADDFIRAVLIAIPALLVLAALTQRVPYDKKQRRGRAKKFWFGLWRYSRWLLLSGGLY